MVKLKDLMNEVGTANSEQTNDEEARFQQAAEMLRDELAKKLKDPAIKSLKMELERGIRSSNAYYVLKDYPVKKLGPFGQLLRDCDIHMRILEEKPGHFFAHIHMLWGFKGGGSDARALANGEVKVGKGAKIELER